LLRVYGDESSDEKKERVFAVAGVIGSEEMWDAIERRWLSRTGGVPFHANNCDSDRGHYQGMPHAENKTLYRDLTVLLAESGLGGWGFAMDLAAMRTVFPDAPDVTYYRCFVEVIAAMRICAVNNQQQVRFSFDKREESDHNAGMLYGMFRKAPEWEASMFPEISFVSSREHARIQVADLFARETMKALDNKVGPVKRPARKSWLALYGTERFHIEAVSIDWYEDTKRKMGEIQTAAGMSHESYLAWLTEYHLVHNVSNMFRYMLWCDQRDRK
jgi:hypothetical protein